MPLVGLGDRGVNHGGALVDGVVSLPQYEVGKGPVFADGAGGSQEGLAAPFFQNRQDRFPAVGGQGSGSAEHEAVGGLGGPQKIKGQDEAHPEHPGDQVGGAVVDLDVAGHGPDPGVLEQGGHDLLQGVGLR